MSKKILVVDPGYGGGIEQATIYLNDYLIKLGHDTRYISFIDYNDKPKIMHSLKNIYTSYNPDLTIIHEFGHIEIFSFLKLFFPKTKVCFFSLPEPVLKDKYYDRVALDFLVSPAYLRSEKAEDKKNIPWMFDMPERFYKAYDKRGDTSSDILYVGRIVEEKLSERFIDEIEGTNINLNAYGGESWVDRGLIEKIKKSNNVKAYKGYPNLIIENLYTKYDAVVLPTKTDCFSLFIVEAILAGCYPFVMAESYYRRYPWMDLNFNTYTNESDMIMGIKDFMRLNKNSKIDLQKKVRESLIDFLKEASDKKTLDNILELNGEEISYYNKEEIEKIAHYSRKY